MRHAKKLTVSFLLLWCILIGSAYSGRSLQNLISEKDIFQVLFDGLSMKGKKFEGTSLRLSESNVDDILIFLKNFPIDSNEFVNKLSSDKNYRFIQSDYGNYFIVFRLGNEPNRWKGKLYTISFTITFYNGGKEVPENETMVYRKLTELYGDYTKVEKFRYTNSKVNDDLNLYIWESSKIVVTYRSVYDPIKRRTAVVVEYWDSLFFKTYPYYEY